MLRILGTAPIVTALISTVAAAADFAHHPLIGKWTWTRSVNNCTETYEYRPNGSFDVISGQEVANGSFEISESPDAKGFYTLKGRTLKTNGGKDCSDSGVPDTDHKPYTLYIIFHRTQPFHLACYERSLDKCFGPLRRTQ